MFRILSDEESQKVTRWQAPELGDYETGVVNTRQFARPQAPEPGADIRALLGSLDLKPGPSQTQSAHPSLQSISSTNVLGGHANTLRRAPGGLLGEISTVSAELLQASYDEGHAKGYAEGSAALHQSSIKELRSIASALNNASMHRIDSDLEQEVIALTLDIARLVIRREVSIDDTLMQNIVSAGLEQLPGSAQFPACVYLHPLDASTVSKYLLNDVELRILDDPSLERGACRIESGSSTVNGGVEDWLACVAEQLGLTAKPADSLPDESPA